MIGTSSTRCLAGAARSGKISWPDVRFWVRQLPDGTNAITRERRDDATTAFDAYSYRHPGTRQVQLGGAQFYAFAAPRLGAEHLTVWRHVADVRAAAEAWQQGRGAGQHPHPAGGPAADHPLRLMPRGERSQLTAPVWCWDNLSARDPNRYLDDGVGGGPWMYWESFWAPAEAAAYATTAPAFGDVPGEMLRPSLGAADEAVARAATSDGHAPPRRAHRDDPAEHVVPSTATSSARKDRAYAIVYQFNVWGSDVSRSGTGSDPWSPEARLAVTALRSVVDRFGVRSMLDCACGDATWIVPYFVAQHPEVSYCGIDIVPEVIDQNKKRHPNLNFLAVDLAESELPSGAELIFSKESLNHMSLDDAQRALGRFRATGARYLLTNVHQGADNEEGRIKQCFTTYVKYDYELPPFALRKLAAVIEYQGPGTSYTLFEL